MYDLWHAECTLPCSDLYDSMPFVFREQLPGQVPNDPLQAQIQGQRDIGDLSTNGIPFEEVEILRIGSKELHRIVIGDAS